MQRRLALLIRGFNPTFLHADYAIKADSHSRALQALPAIASVLVDEVDCVQAEVEDVIRIDLVQQRNDVQFEERHGCAGD